MGVQRECLRHRRQQRREGVPPGDADWRERVCEPGPSPEARVIWSEAMTLLREELEQPPARNVAVLTLLADKEKDYQQISSLLSMSVGSIRPTRARSLGRLRVALRRRGFDRDLPSVS